MFTLTIETDNDAFAEYDGDLTTETARILREVARKLDNNDTDGPCMDANGNKVGTFGFSTLLQPRRNQTTARAR